MSLITKKITFSIDLCHCVVVEEKRVSVVLCHKVLLNASGTF